jgi:enoyl-CoA hydratase
MKDDIVEYQTDGTVGIICMNRPDKQNAFNADLLSGLAASFQRAEQDPAVSVVLLRSNGRSFSVGMDIELNYPKDATERHDPLRWQEFLRGVVDTMTMPWSMKKPVIAEVQGYALGSGCELAMMCDLTVASEDAIFGEPETRLSVFGPAVVMPQFIGLKKARELLYFGDMIDAETALRLGMINRIVPTAELRSQALKYAHRLALISPQTLKLAKLSINRTVEASGVSAGIIAGVDVLAPLYAAKTDAGVKFRELVAERGLGAALRWRNDQFKEE